MTKVLVLYYSSYGHIEAMANAVAEGAREVGAEVTIKRVPELVPEEAARRAGIKLDQPAPIATVQELPDYDAIIFGTPTRRRSPRRRSDQPSRCGASRIRQDEGPRRRPPRALKTPAVR